MRLLRKSIGSEFGLYLEGSCGAPCYMEKKWATAGPMYFSPSRGWRSSPSSFREKIYSCQRVKLRVTNPEENPNTFCISTPNDVDQWLPIILDNLQGSWLEFLVKPRIRSSDYLPEDGKTCQSIIALDKNGARKWADDLVRFYAYFIIKIRIENLVETFSLAAHGGRERYHDR